MKNEAIKINHLSGKQKSDSIHPPSGIKIVSSEGRLLKYKHAIEQLVIDLPRRHYQRILELSPGDAILTRGLAQKSDMCYALNVSRDHVERARTLNSDIHQLAYLEASFPEGCPPGLFDLIVVGAHTDTSYLTDQTMLDKLLSRLEKGGTVVFYRSAAQNTIASLRQIVEEIANLDNFGIFEKSLNGLNYLILKTSGR